MTLLDQNTRIEDLREFGKQPDIGASFQGGFIYLHYYGCKHCGNAFWTEGDDKRKLPAGSAAYCPHCATPSRIPAE